MARLSRRPLLRRRRLRFVISWIVAGAATAAIYFVNFNWQLGGSNDYALHHPAQGLRFSFSPWVTSLARMTEIWQWRWES